MLPLACPALMTGGSPASETPGGRFSADNVISALKPAMEVTATGIVSCVPRLALNVCDAVSVNEGSSSTNAIS